MPPRTSLDAALPRLRLPAALLERLRTELAREQAARPAESFEQADLVRTLLLEALDARAGVNPRTPASREAIGPCRGCGAPIGEPCRRTCPDLAPADTRGEPST